MKSVKIREGKTFSFYNNVDYCVGTGRLGLALTKEYLDELKLVQEEIGFKHIRGHGLFHDDISIYHEYEENGEKKVEYNYTYIDRIFDAYLELNIRPFIELGFMPKSMASGEQCIFYWQGNTTPPKDYKLWTDMVVALLEHLVGRYGEEVYDWPIEVWNEPNLPGFWYRADREEYFKLFKETFLAIKAYDSRFKIGGPAICGVNDEEWIAKFMEFCRAEGLKPDSVTRHHYCIEFPERIGHYDYSKLEDSEFRIGNLKKTRDIIDSFEEYRDLPIHITEFSTSYTPKGVIHDTNINAAYLAGQLARLGESNESYSYWTFGDVFEEQGVPTTPFYGGFGLVAQGCIPKPTFWTFAFYKKLKDFGTECLFKDANTVVVRGGADVDGNKCVQADTEYQRKNAGRNNCGGAGKGFAGILWNVDGADFTRKISVPVSDGEYTLITKTVDEECCNPLKLWHDLGEHAYPDKAEVELLRSAANPSVKSSVVKAVDGNAEFGIEVKKNGVVYFELIPRRFTPDRGYDYDKTVSFH